MRRGRALVLLLLFLVTGRIVVQLQARLASPACAHCFMLAPARHSPRPPPPSGPSRRARSFLQAESLASA
ncbi:hypothetical protein PsYK624_102760 [Phanerochaete sordida]|uniref:Secreted protein n=1 Tax=Phanerochaete sordida TaxID=48140 RepID=A0A9P3LGR8_9APHY|nr:hypothetical protein PsYK624_102760 [Phanerochaete sordida]